MGSHNILEISPVVETESKYDNMYYIVLDLNGCPKLYEQRQNLLNYLDNPHIKVFNRYIARNPPKKNI